MEYIAGASGGYAGEFGEFLGEEVYLSTGTK